MVYCDRCKKETKRFQKCGNCNDIICFECEAGLIQGNSLGFIGSYPKVVCRECLTNPGKVEAKKQEKLRLLELENNDKKARQQLFKQQHENLFKVK